MSFDKRWGGAVLAAVVFGCSSSGQDSSTLPPPPPCTGMFCGNPAGGAVGATGSGGAGTGTSTGVGAAAGINVSGDVHLILSPDFVDTNVLYTGKSTIEGTAPGGQPVTTMYGGGVGGGGGASATMFILDGVASGTTWLGVMDETMGAAGVESTFSQQQGLTALTAMNVTLPVISLQTLQNIASLLPSVQTVGANSAQVILLLENSLGAAYPNVSLSSNPIGGEVAYDTGAGQYTDQDTMTSTGGTIIVFNSGLSGMQTLQLTYLSESTSTMMNQSVMVEGAPGFATIMTVMLQD